jgi:hypothetical protein
MGCAGCSPPIDRTSTTITITTTTAAAIPAQNAGMRSSLPNEPSSVFLALLG